jgi:hypothetical protein
MSDNKDGATDATEATKFNTLPRDILSKIIDAPDTEKLAAIARFMLINKDCHKTACDQKYTLQEILTLFYDALLSACTKCQTQLVAIEGPLDGFLNVFQLHVEITLDDHYILSSSINMHEVQKHEVHYSTYAPTYQSDASFEFEYSDNNVENNSSHMLECQKRFDTIEAVFQFIGKQIEIAPLVNDENGLLDWFLTNYYELTRVKTDPVTYEQTKEDIVYLGDEPSRILSQECIKTTVSSAREYLLKHKLEKIKPLKPTIKISFSSNLIGSKSESAAIQLSELEKKIKSINLFTTKMLRRNMQPFVVANAGGKSSISSKKSVHVLGRNRNITKVGRKCMVMYKGALVLLYEARRIEKQINSIKSKKNK